MKKRFFSKKVLSLFIVGLLFVLGGLRLDAMEKPCRAQDFVGEWEEAPVIVTERPEWLRYPHSDEARERIRRKLIGVYSELVTVRETIVSAEKEVKEKIEEEISKRKKLNEEFGYDVADEIVRTRAEKGELSWNWRRILREARRKEDRLLEEEAALKEEFRSLRRSE